ncbi:putative K02A2.6-like [Lyophyllum shimeji]|uniref:K02A2.6-like n=1 Tax=Lyophyllum shimeji TaxID=47721 RepID=A0A9P3Q242_LYOSH|nr:putative K02A2.6-like [Lyophyllum shimeji]
MAESAKERTAFRYHLGLFQFRRMPFGLRNGPSIFQRIMQGMLAPFLWLFTLVYIDDIVIFSSHGITLSPPKCSVGYASILLLGQKVSRLGLSTYQEKVRAIVDLARPRSISDLQKFLGMVVYFSSYIPFYSFIAAPLFALLRKGVKWTWNAEHEIAFTQVKSALSSAPVLGHPECGQPYHLYTDASDFALGASLQQVQSIAVKDLKGTPMYNHLTKAWNAGVDCWKVSDTVDILLSGSRSSDMRT